MGTLTVKGIQWTASRHNGKLSFGFRRHGIVFVPQTGFYHLKEGGETLFADRSVAICLEHASEVVWEHYAKQFQPSWEKT